MTGVFVVTQKKSKNENTHIKTHLKEYKKFVQWLRWYPDLFLDLITPEEGGIRLDLDQRVFLRTITRMAGTYGTFPRAYGKCVSYETMIFTDEGIKEVGEYFNYERTKLEKYTVLNQLVMNRYGELEESNMGVTSGYKDVKRIRTKLGYEIEASLNHRIIADKGDGIDWIKAKDLSVGDKISIHLDNEIWGQISIPERDIDYMFSKRMFSKEISKEVMQSNRTSIIRFLSRFTAENGFKTHKGDYVYVGMTNKMSKQLQMIFLNFNCLTSREYDKMTDSYMIKLDKKDTKLFEMLFKNKRSTRAKRGLKRNPTDEIVEILDRKTHTADISMNDSQSYVSNGFISHNTFIEILAMYTSAIAYPNLEMFLTAQTKGNAVQLLEQKHNEIMRFYPLLRNEIQKTIFSKDKGELLFKNGSWIKILANDQSSKGNRSHRINIEESALVKSSVFDDALKPIVDIPRRTVSKEPKKSPYEPNGQINFFTTAGFKGTSEYERSLMMYDDMVNCRGKFVLGSDWQLALFFGRGLTRSQIKANENEMSPTSFAQNYESIWVGATDGALVDIQQFIDLRRLPKPEMKSNGKDDYIVAYDVARSNNAKNNAQSFATVLKIKRKKDGTVSTVDCVYLKSIEGDRTFESQAIEAKILVEQFDAKAFVYDANAIGAGIKDEIIKEHINPYTGEVLVPLEPIDGSEVSEYENGKPIAYPLKAGSGNNTDIIINFQDYVRSGRLRLLKSDYDERTAVLDGISDNSELKPFIETDFLVGEVSNLKVIHSGAMLRVVRVARKIEKDRYSALAYGLYYIKKYEDKLHMDDESDILGLLHVN